ncbi:MAG: hypothetical protein V4604_06560 [Bacteroidota bacterium]
MPVTLAICLILFVLAFGVYKFAVKLLDLPVFGTDKNIIHINKSIAKLLLFALAIGFFILVIGILNLSLKKGPGEVLTIAGAILFSSALVSLIVFSNRLKS